MPQAYTPIVGDTVRATEDLDCRGGKVVAVLTGDMSVIVCVKFGPAEAALAFLPSELALVYREG